MPDSLGERVRALEVGMSELARDVGKLLREIDGPGTPDRPPLRRRVHNLEGSMSAALELERARTRKAEREREEATVANDRRWSRKQLLAATLIAFWGGFVAPTVTLALTLLRHH